MNEQGIIVKKEKGQLVVRTFLHKECKGCKTCGAGKPREIIVKQEGIEDFKEGDKVEITIDTTKMLRVYLLIYGIPLVVFASSVILVDLLVNNPAISFITAIFLTAISFLSIGRFLKGKTEYLPQITKKE